MSTIYGPLMHQTYGTYYSSWDYYSSAGFLSYPSPAMAAVNHLALGVLNIPASDFAKILLLGSFWLAGMISFYVLRAMVRSDLAAFIGSLVYTANGAFVNQIVEGHFGFIYAYPFLILIFYLFYEAYTKGITRKTLVLPPLLLAYGGSAAPHMVLLAALMIIFFVTFETLSSVIARKFEHVPYKALFSVTLVFLLVLPLAYMTLVLGDSSVLQATYSLEQASSGASNLLTALAIGGSETTNTYGYYGDTAGQQMLATTQLLALPLFFFAAMSVLAKRYRGLTVPLALAIVVDIFFSMGPNQPMGDLFTILFDHLPFVNSFRALSRFLLLNAMFYSIMIAVTVANWEEISTRLSDGVKRLTRRYLGKWGVEHHFGPSRAFSATLVIVLLIASLSGLALVSNGEVIRAFDPPREYAEPFEYVASLEDDGISYKVLTLPLTTDIYQHPHIPCISGYGYPKGTTLDPGAYLPGIVTQSPMAHSTSSINYWAGIDASLSNRVYGYKDTLALLGSSAGVKYVVEQFYANAGERDVFTDMNNGTVLVTYKSGAQVIGVDDFSAAIKAQRGLIVGSGGLDTMYLLLGMGTFDPRTDSYASIGDLCSTNMSALLDASGLIVVQNGDVFELALDVGLLDDDLLRLVDEVTPHREDQRSQWVVKVNSATQETSVITSGGNDLTVYPRRVVEGPSTLMVRAMFGPGHGDLSVQVNGELLSNISLSAPYRGMDWVSIDIPEGVDRIDSVTFEGSEGALPTEVSDAAIVSDERRDQLRQDVQTLLEPYGSKVGYVFTPLYMYNHDPDALPWYGPEGNGVMSLNRTALSVQFETLFDGSFTLSAFSPDWGARNATLDGDVYDGDDPSGGAYAYDVASLPDGAHLMDVFADGVYGVSLLPSHDLGPSAPELSYQRVSPTEYHISVRNASGPFFIKFSEGPSKYWAIDGEGVEATWFRTDYLANGFLVNGTGDLELTMVFTKQAMYGTFLGVYLLAIVASTATIVGIYVYLKRSRRVR